MTTYDTRGVTHETHHWQDDALCRNRPDDWDLDHLNRDGIDDALEACTHCPVLAQCRTQTRRTRPEGVVQAGFVWPAKNGKQPADIKECPACGTYFQSTNIRRRFCRDPECQLERERVRKRNKTREAAA